MVLEKIYCGQAVISTRMIIPTNTICKLRHVFFLSESISVLCAIVGRMSVSRCNCWFYPTSFLKAVAISEQSSATDKKIKMQQNATTAPGSIRLFSAPDCSSS